MPNTNQRILGSIDDKIAGLKREIEILEKRKAKINRQENLVADNFERQKQIDLNATGYKTGVDSLENRVRMLGKQRVLIDDEPSYSDSSNYKEVDLGGGRKRKTHKKQRLSRKVKKTYRKRR